ncbi:hypothetical protein LWP59_24580 [Amycolatopsis acidiphila]|uniref:Uncharacterized protein n=1 Tax=Amycolatopsis acidiphila TaxID=715473 RepID=A0A558ACI4_9PSEU|nr:hypothetical protein [Amycolatopsis acidiphila]TVT21903.1 hypothetical protein FNH06_15200 [Amycolatopsis acidiphila]UIJ63952.1 hypothetical protein LWP59_24580 [Amycolatopsis acidiphila]GHG84822.1 hypothetical protein GCM10017788_57250 [Amycolatopsis acidiphila]
MHHDTTAATGSAGLDLTALLVRLILLLATAVVAGGGLFGAKPRFAVAGASAVLAAASAVFFDVNVVSAVAHALLVLAVPLLLVRWPAAARWLALALLVLVVVETSLGSSELEFAADTVYVGGATAWFGLAQLKEKPPRYAALTLSLGLLLAVAGAAQLLLSGVAFDRRLYESLFGLSLVAVVVFPLAALALRGRRVAVAGVAVAFLAWTTFVALPHPADLPVPGTGLLTTASLGGQDVPVLVSPQRPGRNLVHVPASAGAGVAVAGVPATARPGADGFWADVDLPGGRSTLRISKGTAAASVAVDTGEGAAVATDPDSPECASATLGALVAGRRDAVAACPADRLSEQDADALRKLVTFLGTRHTDTIQLVADSSRRGAAAADVVRTSARQQGLRVVDAPAEKAALVVVSGWSAAYTTLTQAAQAQRSAPTYTYGLYLAPWLLTGPVVNTVSASTVPLRFDPRDQSAVSYAVALEDAFGGESPTVDGFRSWLGTSEQNAKVQLYASAQVNAMPMNPGQPHAPGMPMFGEGAGHWIPDATVVPVSFPLE